MGAKLKAIESGIEYCSHELSKIKEKLFRTSKSATQELEAEHSNLTLEAGTEKGKRITIEDLADNLERLQESGEIELQHLQELFHVSADAKGMVNTTSLAMHIMEQLHTDDAKNLSAVHERIARILLAGKALDGTLQNLTGAEKQSGKMLAHEAYVEKEVIDKMEPWAESEKREIAAKGKLSNALSHVEEDQKAVEASQAEVEKKFEGEEHVLERKLANTHAGTSEEGVQAKVTIREVRRSQHAEENRLDEAVYKLRNLSSDISRMNRSAEITPEMRNTIAKHEEKIKEVEERIEENNQKTKKSFTILCIAVGIVCLALMGIHNVWRMKIKKLETTRKS